MPIVVTCYVIAVVFGYVAVTNEVSVLMPFGLLALMFAFAAVFLHIMLCLEREITIVNQCLEQERERKRNAQRLANEDDLEDFYLFCGIETKDH